MGAITAGAILTKVSQVLLDESNARWTSADLLVMLNEAQRIVAAHDERACTTAGIARLETGLVIQRLPATARLIRDMPRNLSTT